MGIGRSTAYDMPGISQLLPKQKLAQPVQARRIPLSRFNDNHAAPGGRLHGYAAHRFINYPGLINHLAARLLKKSIGVALARGERKRLLVDALIFMKRLRL